MARSTLCDFELLEQLGTGSFGVVWKGKRKVDQLVYALKELRVGNMSRQVGTEHFIDRGFKAAKNCEKIESAYWRDRVYAFVIRPEPMGVTLQWRKQASPMGSALKQSCIHVHAFSLVETECLWI